jgi:hypothetical protein
VIELEVVGTDAVYVLVPGSKVGDKVPEESVRAESVASVEMTPTLRVLLCSAGATV